MSPGALTPRVQDQDRKAARRTGLGADGPLDSDHTQGESAAQAGREARSVCRNEAIRALTNICNDIAQRPSLYLASHPQGHIACV
jgi:hypothetical protein